jgi:hypothetical protein
MAKKNGELAEVRPGYLEGVSNIEDVMLALRENIGTESLTRFDFPRIKTPQGESRYMEMPSADDPEGEAVTSFSGVIIGNHMTRSYWKQGVGSSGMGEAPPDCASNDAIMGIGDPGGECQDCPMARFKTDKGGQGRGQACKAMRAIYILRPGMLLPVIIQVPPTSLKAVRQYLFSLAATGRPYYTVETEIGLSPKKNADGEPYNQFTFKRARLLEGEERKTAEQYAGMFLQLLTGTPEYPSVPVPDEGKYSEQ